MKAIEFETHTDGGIIRIPPDYHELDNKDVRVIILVEEQDNHKKKVSAFPGPFRIHTKGIRFNREEANER